MGTIKGIHHVSMKTCNEDEYKNTVEFYKDILNLKIARTWENGIMFETGTGLIEIFKDGDVPLEKGVIRHFAMVH